MNRKDEEIEDWEDFETMDEARNEIKRLREESNNWCSENKRLLDRCISLVEQIERLREEVGDE